MITTDINYTFIIPHYNIPELLMRCLKSIPVRDDIQVIVVDDCSPDADTYKTRFPELSRPNLEFYSTSKGGSAGRARNVGLDHAKGKWLLFADADDLFTDKLEKVLNDNVNAEEDVIYFNVKCVMCDDITQPTKTGKGLKYNNYFQNIKENKSKFICEYPSPWAKIIRKSLVDNYKIRFDETRWSNDYYFIASAGLKAKKIKAVNEVIYYITEREGSLSHSFCHSMDELLVRTDVAFKVQKLISDSPYKDSNIIILGFLHKLFLRNKPMFKNYFKKVNTIGLSKMKVIKRLSQFSGSRRYKLNLWSYVLFHCFF